MLMRDIYCSANILLKQHSAAAKSHATHGFKNYRRQATRKARASGWASSTQSQCWS